MTPALRSHLEALTPKQRAKMRRDSTKMIREALAHRHSHPIKARIMLSANVRMLRNLAEIGA